jgi:type VI secretion system secreted protein Hcp
VAQVDYFLKLKGVDGEATDDKHKNELDIESWTWGETNAGTHSTGGGGGAGKVSMQDIHFVVKMSKASPKLFLACATGQHIEQAVLTCRKAGADQQEYLHVTISDCLVSSFQTGGSTADVVPTDQFSLNFAKIEFCYKEQLANGSLGAAIRTGYDLKLNKKI